MRALPAVWVSDGKRAVGKLDIFADRICLDGSCDGVESRRELRQSEIRSVRHAAVDERLLGNPTLVIEPVSGPTIRLMPLLFSLGTISELIRQMQLGA